MEIEQFEDDFVVASGSPDFRSELAAQLAELAPEVIADGKVDVAKLQELLGEDVVDSAERFGLFWPGKKNALRAAQAPTTATLRPDLDNSLNWDETENLFIEGDNLEVLKVLQRHYHNKVKLIYIDPPYNTGNDFVYPDNFKEGLENYLEWTRQVNDEGKKISSNSETEGRYHSNWLNMMYPRLKLARNLLTEDGAIFVSIDFNEVDNLKKMMDEIFGERNFQREIVWRIGWLSGYKTTAPNFIRNHDAILFYSKNKDSYNFNKKYIENKDFKPLIKPEPKIKAKLTELGLDADKQKDLFHFVNHDNRPERYPLEDTWNSSEYDDLNSIAIVSFSGEKVSKILGLEEDFKGQKSIKMLSRILESTTSGDDIVLDFFSGTSSTAHAVWDLNNQDGANRKFIMVQLPEPTDPDSSAAKKGFTSIADISRARLKAVSTKYQETSNGKMHDTGFRSYKLSESNFTKWQVTSDVEAGKLGQLLNSLRGSANDDATLEDLLTEVLLKQGYSLSEQIAPIEVHGLNCFSVAGGVVLAYLNEHVKPNLEQLRAVVELQPARLIVLEDAYQGDDELKTNLEQLCRSKSIELWRA